MKVSELFEAVGEDIGNITIAAGSDGEFVVRSSMTKGPMVGAMFSVFKDLIDKKGVTITVLRKNRHGKAVPTALTKDDTLYVMNNRIVRLNVKGVAEAALQAVVDKAMKKAQNEVEKTAKYKADAPKRKAEAAKYNAEKRKGDMAEYDKKYGKGTWNRVTYKQEGGDDGYQYVVRVDGRSKWNGLTQREAMSYKLREVDAIAKREKLGKYAEKAVTEARKPKVEKDYSPLGQLKELPQPITINGGSYAYTVDVTKTPLKFTASDGESVDKAKTLEDLAKWLDRWAAKLWLEFLKGEESIDTLMAEDVIRFGVASRSQRGHEAKMREGLAPGQKVWKDDMKAKGATSFKHDTHGGGAVNRIVAYDKDGKVLGGFNLK